MEYKGANLGISSYDFKFVRVRDNISVTAPGDNKTPHETLAKNDGLFEELNKLKITNPDEVDGGSVSIDNNLKYVILVNRSIGLGIPVDEESRLKSVTLFEAKTPGYTVENLEDF